MEPVPSPTRNSGQIWVFGLGWGGLVGRQALRCFRHHGGRRPAPGPSRSAPGKGSGLPGRPR
eukprot:2572505-Pyramimonas_sp.AAC.1